MSLSKMTTMITPMETVELPPAIKSATTQDAERASNSNEHEEEDRYDKPKEIYMATDIEDANRDCISNEHEEENRDDNSKEGYMALERTEHLTTTSLDTGSKTLHLYNLSFAIEEEDVRDFFKDVGEIAAIRFVIRDE